MKIIEEASLIAYSDCGFSFISACIFKCHYSNDNFCTLRSKKMLGCLNPNLGQIWTNPNVGLKM